MKQIIFIKDYSVLTTSGATKHYPASNMIINCPDDEKAQEVIDRGFAVAVDMGVE
jgi:hypothetical protein